MARKNNRMLFCLFVNTRKNFLWHEAKAKGIQVFYLSIPFIHNMINYNSRFRFREDCMTNQYCPICGEQNRCMVDNEHPCWCFEVGGFPKELLNKVPEESKGKQCICKKCLEAFNEGQPHSK